MSFLCDELKDSVNVTIALKNNILNVLVEALVNSLSFMYPSLIQNLLRLLFILTLNMNGAESIAKDEVLMKNLLKIITDEHFEQYSSDAAEILLSITIFPSVVDLLLKSKTESIYLQVIQQLLMALPSNEKAVEAVKNVVLRKPEMFAKARVINALYKLLLVDNRKFDALKLLGAITGSVQGTQLADKFDLLSVVILMVEGEDLSNERATDAILVIKHCMLSSKSLCNKQVPWTTLIEYLISKAYNKENNFLQQVSIQALRAMSDKPEIKKHLYSVYKNNVRDIPCLSE